MADDKKQAGLSPEDAMLQREATEFSEIFWRIEHDAKTVTLEDLAKVTLHTKRLVDGQTETIQQIKRVTDDHDRRISIFDGGSDVVRRADGAGGRALPLGQRADA